jgi:hypothetical protein
MKMTKIAYTGDTGLQPGFAPREMEFVSITRDRVPTGF